MREETKKTTIVSAFMANITTPQCLETNENNKKYTEYFIPLLQANVDKIIFIDDSVVDKYKMYENKNTRIVPFRKESNYLYEHMNKITNFNLNNNNPDKDTIQYMFTMCHKTEWVKMAIEMYPHMEAEKRQYIWVDFGVKHMCKCTNEEFTTKIERLGNTDNQKVRIASIWDLNVEKSNNIYKDMSWYFGGSVFGGSKNFLIEFARLMKQICLEIIETRQTIMWEVNIWYLVYKRFRFLFMPYTCDHNASILDNY
jgi:hypothetical protein